MNRPGGDDEVDEVDEVRTEAVQARAEQSVHRFVGLGEADAWVLADELNGLARS